MAIPAPDTTLPTASLPVITNITVAGGTTMDLVVTYSDNSLLKTSTIGAGDIQVTRPSGTNPAVQFISKTPPSGDAATITATYRLTPPGGSWDSTDNATYTVTMMSAQVTDTSDMPWPAVR